VLYARCREITKEEFEMNTSELEKTIQSANNKLHPIELAFFSVVIAVTTIPVVVWFVVMFIVGGSITVDIPIENASLAAFLTVLIGAGWILFILRHLGRYLKASTHYMLSGKKWSDD
jgi:hypothetical protein